MVYPRMGDRQMSILFTSVAGVRMGLTTIVELTSAHGPVAISVSAAPQRPNRPYTAKIPPAYRREVYDFLAKRLSFPPIDSDTELLTLTYDQAAHVVKLAARLAERTARLST